MRLVAYDLSWPDQFRSEAAVVAECLGIDVARIEHVGSTAVSGLASKALIDMVAALETPALFQNCDVLLSPAGYVRDDTGDSGWAVFIKGQHHRFHLHVVEADGWHYWRMILFRDFLRANPSTARDYEALKFALAKSHTHRKAYSNAKSDFVQEIVRQALEARPDLRSRFVAKV